MKKASVTLAVASLLLASLSPVLTRQAGAYDHERLAVAEGWTYGNADHWALQPVNEKTSFAAGEKVQFFAQVGPIREAHQWRLRLYQGSALYREVTNDKFYPDPYWGWNYSNFVPYMTDLPAGSYRADYLLDSGPGYTLLGSKSFTVAGNGLPYVFDHAVTSAGWAYGTGDAYWDLRPTDARTTFTAGEKVWCMVQTRNIRVNHRYKVELFKDSNKLWEYATPLNKVGGGWTYSNFYPYYDNAQPGSYTFKAYIDTGGGFTLLASAPFTVTGTVAEYVFDHSVIAGGWQHGQGGDYWNLSPTDVRTAFSIGSRAYAVSQVRNIMVRHRWKAELYEGGLKRWEYVTPYNEVGGGWAFGNFTPYLDNAQAGSYEFRVYIDSGTGFTLLAERPFTVTGI